MGESTEPWGTPASMLTFLDLVFEIFTLQDLLDRNESMSRMKAGLSFREISLWIRPSCQTLSKARSMSKKTAAVHSLRFECLVVSVWNSSRGLMVERWGLKPNCWSGRRLCVSRSGAKRDARIFSKILPMMLRREIGR